MTAGRNAYPVAFIRYSEEADDQYGAGWQVLARTANGEMHQQDHPTVAAARRYARSLGIGDIVEFT